MRRGPSLEPRRKLGASYGKETRNGGPYNVSACDEPRGHTHVHHRRSVTLAYFAYFWSPCLPRVYRHVISQPRPSPFLRHYHLPRKSKRTRNGEGLGPRLVLYHTPHNLVIAEGPPSSLEVSWKILRHTKRIVKLIVSFAQLPCILLTLGAHAQEGYCSCLVCVCVCVCVCVSVCLSVTTLAATSFVFTLKNRYVGVCYRLFF